MSFFRQLQNQNRIPSRNEFSLWKINLSEEDIERLTTDLQYATLDQIDPRDVTIYYSLWWKNHYNGGAPSKQDVFESLEGNSRYNLDVEKFYRLAKLGAQMLGIKWIKKQNTLYFRTLLLQGGLPISHIAANQGTYQNFLLAVLEEQPETIEDFIFKPEIIGILPKSSQNDIIYENCFEIVKSIINKEDIYDDLLSSNEVLKSISTQLKIRRQSLVPKARLSKPQNYWLLSFEKEKPSILLRIGFAASYNVASLTNILGFEATEREYQFYLNERLICVFRRMLNGNFQTDWYQQLDQHWDGESNLPYAYIIENGRKTEIKDFIQTIPNLHEPSLWTKYSETEWRLVKGSGTSDKEAAILFPMQWHSDLPSLKVSIYGYDLSWSIFEGEIQISLDEEIRKYRSEVNSFDWTIISQKPNWMLKSSMPVVQKTPKIIVYDENNKALPNERYKVWVKRRQYIEAWEELSRLKFIHLGCLELKIEKEGLVAYDSFFNLGNLQVDFLHKSIDKAKLELRNNNSFEFKLDNSPILNIVEENSKFLFEVKTEFSKIPNGIKGSVGIRSKKKLYFEMLSPFEGMAIVDKEGHIIETKEPLSLTNLYGLRILSTPNKETIVRLRNKIKSDVKINKEITDTSYPLISFKEDITRLYYLQDAMDYRNKVSIELIEGKEVKTYEISLFSHNLNVDNQFENNFTLYNSEDELDLFAIPLNCETEEIVLLPMFRQADVYKIPNTEITNQFVVISPIQNGNQLMPRFVNLNEDFEGQSKDQRIEEYHTQLASESFEHKIWKEVLAYFNLCLENEIPFSTFDQIKAISRSSDVSARAFLYLGINQINSDEFIQKAILELERDLGFCFHWIKKEDWFLAAEEVSELYGMQHYNDIIGLLTSYLRENNLLEIFKYFNDNLSQIESVYNSDISYARQLLGERVLNELPYGSPKISSNYGIPITLHKQIKLLLKAPIAVAESIADTQKDFPIWGGNEFRENIRRNIQYSQYLDRHYLDSKFYKRIIIQALKN